MKKTKLVATLTAPPSESGEELRGALEDVEYLEVRADLVGKIDPDWLRDRFPGKLVYTLRSRSEGGAFEGGKESRRRRLAAAARSYDLVDLEGRRDVFDELLAEVPPEKRLISWHGLSTHLADLHDRFERLASTPARFYKLIPTATREGDGLRPLQLLSSLKRDDVIVFASGEVGAWTRLVAPRLGSALVYGALGKTPGAPGQISIERLVRDYGLPALPEVERIFGIAGRPVLHSLSPRLHNGAYRRLGIPALYVPFHVESFGDFWLELVESEGLDLLGLPLAGLSVTSPYKEVALAVSGVSSPRAQHIAAANTLVRSDGGVWQAETTDPEGVSRLLAANGVAISGCRAAVVGCGGAGKAAAYGLELAGAEVTLVNRGRERGERAAEEMGLAFLPLAELDPAEYEILVHATPLGHRPDDELPFPVDRIGAETTVIDLVYGPSPTRLVGELRALGRRVFGGRRVLLHQAFDQFRLMTGEELEEPLAREILGLGEDP